MRGLRLGLSLSLAGGASSPFAVYAFADDFDSDAYWQREANSGTAGTQHSAPSTLGGYAFTASGTCYELNSDGTIAGPFAANVPAITDEGFKARQSLTNSQLYSQQFDNAAWTKQEITVTANNAVAPDGTTTADKAIASINAAGQRLLQSLSATSGVTYTMSVFAKAAGENYLQLLFGTANFSGSRYVNFDLSNGTVGGKHASVTASITALPNGWYRCTATTTADATAAGNSGYSIVTSTAAGYAANYAGNGTNGIHLWQGQILNGNCPNGGPIIVTTSAAATRGEALLAHNIFADGSALADQDMLIFVRGTPSEIVSGGTQTLGTLYVSANERIRLQLESGVLRAIVTVGGVDVYSQQVAGAWVAGTEEAAVLRRSGSNWRVSKYIGTTLTNGTEAAGTFPTGLTKAYIGNAAAGSLAFRGTIADARIRTGTFSTDQEVIDALEAAEAM